MTENTKGVFIIVQDREGKQISKFEANEEISLAAQSNQHQCNVPIACGSGACMVCACKIVSGLEYVDVEKFGKQLVQPGEGTILSCVAGIKDKYLEKDGYFEVIIQKLI